MLHAAAVLAFGILVFSGPFVCGLLRWPFRRAIFLAWPVGFFVLVAAAMGAFGASQPEGGEPWSTGVALIGVLVLWLSGVSGLSYGFGSLVRRGGERRFRWKPRPAPAVERWPIQVFTLLVSMAAGVLMLSALGAVGKKRGDATSRLKMEESGEDWIDVR